MTKNLICIACPRGCHLHVEFDETQLEKLQLEDIIVTQNGCPRGVAYGKQEVIAPLRTLTTTVSYRPQKEKRTAFCLSRLPVKTGCEIPLKEMFLLMKKIRNIQIVQPVRCGEVIASIEDSKGKIIPLVTCVSTEELV